MNFLKKLGISSSSRQMAPERNIPKELEEQKKSY